jgi:hypothetical protein
MLPEHIFMSRETPTANEAAVPFVTEVTPGRMTLTHYDSFGAQEFVGIGQMS